MQDLSQFACARLARRARTLADTRTDNDLDALARAAERIETILQQQEEIGSRLLEATVGIDHFIFIGSGPHAATARQSAMMLGEWPKVQALSFSVGAFRHGFVETIEPGVLVLLFAAPGPAYASTLRLGAELQGYGARVLVITHGVLRTISDSPVSNLEIDEFLAPLLDIVPMQLFADALAGARGVPPGVRYIGKVIEKI